MFAPHGALYLTAIGDFTINSCLVGDTVSLAVGPNDRPSDRRRFCIVFETSGSAHTLALTGVAAYNVSMQATTLVKFGNFIEARIIFNTAMKLIYKGLSDFHRPTALFLWQLQAGRFDFYLAAYGRIMR